MAVNIVNKDLQDLQFQEGRPTQYTPVTFRPTRPLLPFTIIPGPKEVSSIQIIKNTLSVASTPADTDLFLLFRGTWQSFIAYSVNDVVVQNLSTYVAIQGSVGLRPDQNPLNWTILGENLVFSSNVLLFDGHKLNFSTAGSSPVIGSLTPSAPNDLAFLALSQRETDLDSSWVKLYTSGGAVAVAIKALPTAAPLATTLTNTGFPWGSNLLFFKGGFPTLTGSITSVQIISNVVTCQCVNAFIVGTQIIVNGLAGANFLNGTQAQITAVTASSFSFAFTHANYGPAADNGTVTWLPYFQMVSASFPGTNNSNTTDHLIFPNPVKSGSLLVFVGITGDNNAVASLVSITDTVGNTWVPYGDSHFGCGASVGYCQSSNSGTVDMACFGTWSTPSDVGIAFEFPVAIIQSWEPYDVVEFRGSMFVCLRETATDAFSDPTSWALIGPGVGSVDILSANYLAISTDSGRLLSFNSSSAVTLTLPNPVSAPPSGSTETGWMIFVENIGTGVLTISNNTRTIDGVAGNLTLGQNQGVVIFADATGNYKTYHGMNSIVVPNIFTVTVPNGSGQITIGLATQSANTFWRGPSSGAPAQPVFGPIVAGDIPSSALPPLALTVVVLTQATHKLSGTLLINGQSPPAGVYRLSANFFLQANPSAGTLAVSFGYNDGTAARTDSPASMDTSALNLGEHDIVIVSDGIHDITWSMTLV